MLRGIDKRDLFLKDSDYEKFLAYIKKAKEKSEFAIYAYCLMTNHIHILLKSETEEIGNIIRRITVGYAQYHNIQNGRTGHLFQNRFKSEVVDSDEYFLTVLRYIHQNPTKAGIVKNMKNYKWSSYNEYINNKKTAIIETGFALSYFKDFKEFTKYMEEKNVDTCLEDEQKKRWIDEELREFISSFLDKSRLSELDIKSRDEILKNIKENTGASNRQLSRVINIGRGILDKIG